MVVSMAGKLVLHSVGCSAASVVAWWDARTAEKKVEHLVAYWAELKVVYLVALTVVLMVASKAEQLAAMLVVSRAASWVAY